MTLTMRTHAVGLICAVIMVLFGCADSTGTVAETTDAGQVNDDPKKVGDTLDQPPRGKSDRTDKITYRDEIDFGKKVAQNFKERDQWHRYSFRALAGSTITLKHIPEDVGLSHTLWLFGPDNKPLRRAKGSKVKTFEEVSLEKTGTYRIWIKSGEKTGEYYTAGPAAYAVIGIVNMVDAERLTSIGLDPSLAIRIAERQQRFDSVASVRAVSGFGAKQFKKVSEAVVDSIFEQMEGNSDRIGNDTLAAYGLVGLANHAAAGEMTGMGLHRNDIKNKIISYRQHNIFDSYRELKSQLEKAYLLRWSLLEGPELTRKYHLELVCSRGLCNPESNEVRRAAVLGVLNAARPDELKRRYKLTESTARQIGRLKREDGFFDTLGEKIPLRAVVAISNVVAERIGGTPDGEIPVAGSQAILGFLNHVSTDELIQAGFSESAAESIKELRFIHGRIENFQTVKQLDTVQGVRKETVADYIGSQFSKIGVDVT